MTDISEAMEELFNRVLPIPKKPRLYHPSPPAKPLTWVPHGRLGDQDYEKRLEPFASELLAINSKAGLRIKPGTRGWCYVLEGLNKITKDEFAACQRAINDCRKIGLLPIDFVAEDQDLTRHFDGIIDASSPREYLQKLKKSIAQMQTELPRSVTDFWKGEEFYVMMCVEKGDIKRLFQPICEEYHVPIVSSKGWSPLLLRRDIARLAEDAEDKGLTPVLLLFYDHDPVGLKISDLFGQHLEDCKRSTGYDPSGLIIVRFGLNKEDIDKYKLMWIDNLRSASGRESTDYDYIEKFGRRKCESNALFKNNRTLKAAEEICRNSIESYYGEDALERFKKKESAWKEKLGPFLKNPAWKNANKAIDDLIKTLPADEDEEAQKWGGSFEEEVVVKVDNEYYGECPNCSASFNYGEEDIGKRFRCRNCGKALRLRWKKTPKKRMAHK